MQIKVRLILFLACLLVTSCGSSTDASIPTMTATETPALIPTATKTATPTFTPEPTATITPTHTETVFVLDPSVVVTDEAGAPVLVDGRAQFNFVMDYDKLPEVQDLEKLSGYEAWSPEFIRWLHTGYIPKLQVNGSPLVTPFDPNTVCQVPWIAGPKSGNMAYSNFGLENGIVCKVGTFPVRKTFVIKDDERGFFTVTQQI